MAGCSAVLAVRVAAGCSKVTQRAAFSTSLGLTLVEHIASYPPQLDGAGEVLQQPLGLVPPQLDIVPVCTCPDAVFVP